KVELVNYKKLRGILLNPILCAYSMTPALYFIAWENILFSGKIKMKSILEYTKLHLESSKSASEFVYGMNQSCFLHLFPLFFPLLQVSAILPFSATRLSPVAVGAVPEDRPHIDRDHH
ncbi:hypothetical protein ACJX0J_006596, partial [Zea mays]